MVDVNGTETPYHRETGYIDMAFHEFILSIGDNRLPTGKGNDAHGTTWVNTIISAGVSNRK